MKAFLSSASASESPLTSLVKRLQEALGRAEEFDVLTALPSGGDSRSNPATMLGRQLRMRLAASTESGIPRSVANVVVSIHAIATFASFNDYLRPRIAAALAAEERAKSGSRATTPGLAGAGSANSRLSGVLAALAAASGLPAPDLEGSAAAFAEALSGSAPDAGTAGSAAASRPAPPVERRRSSRLSARSHPPTPAVGDAAAANPSGTSSAPAGDVASRSNAALAAAAAEALAACGDLHDEDDDEEDRMDEEEDDILDEELEAAGNSTMSAEERLVNFEVADDGSRVNASTPDGTRIQTPVPGQSLAQRAQATAGGANGQALSGPPTPSAASASAAAGTSGAASTSTGAAPPAGRSYAAALKKAPEDWHLEFSMGGKPIDMESTIFGAVYQHEVRSGNTAGIRGVWQNVYTVNFRKVPGAPPQARECSLVPKTLICPA